MNRLKIKGDIFAIVSEDTSALVIDCFALKSEALHSFETLAYEPLVMRSGKQFILFF
jgi:hypothetical protein